ncbi:MAG TPA: cupin domain-containing protein [Solirubrobacteraceae bacterium]|nr:cupin domain-containing protein [Solirubrobacteraceae bacterium]
MTPATPLTPATTAATSATPPTPATTAPPPSAAPAQAPRGALELTLDPVGREEFLARHWERAPLRLARDEAGRFDGLLAVADAEELVCSTGIRVPAFRLARDGTQVPLSGYTEDVPWSPGRFSGLARVDRVAAEYADGATIILQALHLHWRPVAEYCRGLEAALGWPVQANAYLTPASAQGFAVHHDTHDVLVLQVAGEKRWRLYPPVLELPLKSQRWSGEWDAGEPCEELTLRPGDTLYIPRGWPHEAVATHADSLHLTVGLHPPTRLDALRAALEEAAAGDVELRRSLGADGALPRDVLDRLDLSPEAVAARARRRFVAGRRPILDDQLACLRAADGLGVDDPVARRATVIADRDGATLRFEGREVAFPERVREAVEFVHGAPGPFTAAELPGPLDAPGRLVLVRRLVREGYLRPVRA